MSSPGPAPDWHLLVAIAALVALTSVAALAGRLPTSRASVVAVGRAIVQLLAVVAVVRVVFEHVWLAVGFAAVMLAVAALTSASRGGVRRRGTWVALALLAGAVPVLGIVFGTGSTPFTPPSVVAVSGIVIGGVMTSCTLSLRRLFAALRERRMQVDAALALGLDRVSAIRLVVDRERPEALVPILDQTRTVGLVTLPGAFVGVLLGGGSPGEAAAAQLVVLAGLVAAETITVVVTGRLVACGRLLPDDLALSLPRA